MKMRIDHFLDEKFIKAGIYKFLDFEYRPVTKKHFLNFLKESVRLFGSCEESCWGLEYNTDNEETLKLFNKWFSKDF